MEEFKNSSYKDQVSLIYDTNLHNLDKNIFQSDNKPIFKSRVEIKKVSFD